MNKYKIVAFDGGGVRGTLSARILQSLCTKVPYLLDEVQLFSGTSTGSLIALCLAYGLKPYELVKMYLTKLEFIFSLSRNGFFRPKYNNKNLKILLNSIFPSNLCLKDLPSKVIIPAFKLVGNNHEHWAPVFFNNYPNSLYQDTKVIDVALASTAAPVYFPAHDSYIDGGVIVNNPSVAAIAIAKDSQAGMQPLDKIYLLSLGTGFSSKNITANTSCWGALQWLIYPPLAPALLDVFSEGIVGVESHLCRQLLGEEHFLRINPTLWKPVGLDEYKKIPLLLQVADKFDLNTATKWLKKNWF